ncbi:MAG TPA: vWA domain-containing protein [Xanthobacteraceae bacterium]|nr:vWA domain-containing protein [Xanthobacteraceae bacterium]
MDLPAKREGDRTWAYAPHDPADAPAVREQFSAELHLAGAASSALPEFDFNLAGTPRAARAARAPGAPGEAVLERPFNMRHAARAEALGTLTLVALTIALIDKLAAAPSEPFLQDDPIGYKDLQHGTLLISPRGGTTGEIVLDDPELTIVVGPPATGFAVQQVANSASDMAVLLSFAEAVNNVYLLGLADPFTTGSIQRAEAPLFLPELPAIPSLASFQPLLLSEPDPVTNPGRPDFGGSNGGVPRDELALTFAVDDTRVVSHDERPGLPGPGGGTDDTDDPFPISLAGIFGFGPNTPVLGRARDGTPADPFVNTAGSVFGVGNIIVTLEAGATGVASGLAVTNGDPIYLFTETTSNGDQVVIGREGAGNTADPAGAIAFVVFIAEDGEALWTQQSLPIDHGDTDSALSISDDALVLRVTLTDGSTTIQQTQPVGHLVAFEDDAPAAVTSASVEAQGVAVDVNALIILDKSGSMSGEPMALAKQAILDFADQPNVVSIRILAFDGIAHQPSEWFDLTEDGALASLQSFLDSISTGGGTNYQDAIHDAQETWQPPPTDADVTNVYFISDGVASPGLTEDNTNEWEDFLEQQGIANAYAIGINTAVSNDQLQAVAYPDESENVIIMSTADDLLDTLEATTLAGQVSGHLDFGSDGPGFIKSLSYDSDDNGSLDATHLFDENDIEFTFQTSTGESFTLNSQTGEWKYTTPDSFDEAFEKHFEYTIVDGDGDEVAASLNITVSLPSDPLAQMLLVAQSTPVD